MNFLFPHNYNSTLSSFLEKYIVFPSASTYPIDKSYAVVFSSPTLLDKKLGHEIDNHDYVIRFNFAPTKGFEDHVGSKTTHRFLGGHRGTPYFYREKNERVYSWITGSNPRDIGNIFISPPVANTVKYTYEASLHKENDSYFKNFNFMYCSTFDHDAGMKFVDNILLMGDHPLPVQIDIYGFEPNINSKVDSYHYFDDTTNKAYVNQVMKDYNLNNLWDKIISGAKINQAYINHNYSLSKQMISNLAEEGKLNLK